MAEPRPTGGPTAPPGAPGDDVRAFFDRQQQQGDYESLKAMTADLDRDAARRLNARATGDVLSVGGIWDHYDPGGELRSLTVLDLSAEMLKAYCPAGATGIVGDVYSVDFADASFDTVVFPLMLHHTPEGNWRACEGRVETALRRARRWLRPGGRVLILEYCPNRPVALAERAALPLTRRFLAHFGQPLVVMYPRAFYERTLTAVFGSARAEIVAPEGFDYGKWYPIFMSVRWLRVPLAVYPKMHVLSATVPASA